MSRPLGFRAILASVFGLVCCAMVATSSLSLLRTMQTRLADEHQGGLQTLAHNVGVMLSEGLYERMHEVELIAAAPERARTDDADWRALVAQMRESRPHLAWIGVTDAKGIVRVASGGMLEGEDVSAQPWFQHALPGPFAGDVHPAKLLADRLPRAADAAPIRFVDFAAPLKGADGQVNGVLGVHGSWDWASDVIRSLQGQGSGESGVLVFIVDRQGQVILRPAGPPGQGELPNPLPAAGAGTMLGWADGTDYLTATAPVVARTAVTDLGWTVVVRQPAQIALAAAHEAALLTLVIGLAIGLAGLIGVWWVAGRLSDPLAALATAARRIGGGDLSTGIPLVGSAKELRELSFSLQQMMETLDEQKEALECANFKLERRVRERTQELERATDELARLARHDALTGLGNRRVADERLEQELGLYQRHGSAFSVMLLDVDHFERINDVHGHAVGDAVLVQIAQRLAAACRGTDAVCRFGGEAFVVVMSHTPAAGARAAAEKLRRLIADNPVAPVGSVSVSVGVATANPLTVDAATLLKAADDALYAAKRGGRNRVVVHAPAPQAALAEGS